MGLRLRILPESFAVCRLPAGAAVPAWATAGGLHSVTSTAHELSVVCLDAAVPSDTRAERGWRAFMVDGPLDFSLTGVLRSLAEPLAVAGISVFAISTFETDYVLVRDASLEAATRALAAAGHLIA